MVVECTRSHLKSIVWLFLEGELGGGGTSGAQ